MDKNLVLQATSKDDTPTSGYQITEIIKLTNANYEACRQIQDLLLDRLQKKNSYNTKYKCLLIIKHICRTGRPEFKRDMQRHTEVIREHLQFKGPPDPLRGDHIYQRVRDAAREALDAVFDSHVPGSATSNSTISRIVGLGSNPTETCDAKNSKTLSLQAKNWFRSEEAPSSHYSKYNESSTKMTGFGNSPIADPKSFLSRAADGVGSLVKIASSKIIKSEKESFSPEGYANNLYESPHHKYDPYAIPKQSTFTGSTSNAKNSWGNNAVPSYQPTSATWNTSNKNSAVDTVIGRAGGADVDRGYERNQISELCAPGGTKATPPPDKMQDFLRGVLTLDSETVGSLILEQLARPEWQAQSKALCLIEAIAAQPGCEALCDYFRDWADEMIEPLSNAQKTSVRDRAVKALRALGISIKQSPPSEKMSTVVQGSSQLDVDLMNPSDSAAITESSILINKTSSPNTRETQSPSNDLFAGMITKSPPVPLQPNIPQSENSLFSNLSVKAPPCKIATPPFPPTQAPEPTPTTPDPTLIAPFQPIDNLLALESAADSTAIRLEHYSPPPQILPTEPDKIPTLLEELSILSTPPPPPKEQIPTLSAQLGDAMFDPLLCSTRVPTDQPTNTMAMQMQQLQYQNMLLQQQMMQMSLAQQQPLRTMHPMMGAGGIPNVIGQNPMQYNVRVSNALSGGPGQGNSSFSFVDSNVKQQDSFSFVKEAMKQSKS